MNYKVIFYIFISFNLFVLSGCAQKNKYDYTAFNEAKPASILVLLPINESSDLNASHAVLSQVTFPLAEAGYYVFPVVLTNEIFKQDGLTIADEIQSVNLNKLNAVFGADAVLYLKIKNYGTSYKVIVSDTRVTLEAKLIDGKTGNLLWDGSSTASTLENGSNNGLLAVLIEQVINTVTDKSFDISNIAVNRLLLPFPTKDNGILYGPRVSQK